MESEDADDGYILIREGNFTKIVFDNQRHSRLVFDLKTIIPPDFLNVIDQFGRKALGEKSFVSIEFRSVLEELKKLLLGFPPSHTRHAYKAQTLAAAIRHLRLSTKDISNRRFYKFLCGKFSSARSLRGFFAEILFGLQFGYQNTKLYNELYSTGSVPDFSAKTSGTDIHFEIKSRVLNAHVAPFFGFLRKLMKLFDARYPIAHYILAIPFDAELSDGFRTEVLNRKIIDKLPNFPTPWHLAATRVLRLSLPDQASLAARKNSVRAVEGVYTLTAQSEKGSLFSLVLNGEQDEWFKWIENVNSRLFSDTYFPSVAKKDTPCHLCLFVEGHEEEILVYGKEYFDAVIKSLVLPASNLPPPENLAGFVLFIPYYERVDENRWHVKNQYLMPDLFDPTTQQMIKSKKLYDALYDLSGSETTVVEHKRAHSFNNGVLEEIDFSEIEDKF